MGLIIMLRHDLGLTIESDDKGAENARLLEAFQGTVEEYEEDGDILEEDFPLVDYDVIKAWEDTPMVDGKLVVDFAPKDSKDIIEALESAGFEVDEEIYRAVNTTPARRPKPQRS